MVKDIVTDTVLLSKKSTTATKMDMHIAIDLKDTLKANKNCVGMAANMIGVNKRIIVVDMVMTSIVMFNPVIIKKSNSYNTQEGCLSLKGLRNTRRYQTIQVEYYDMNWNKQVQSFNGFIAQIIQHEIDHCDGILI